MYDRITKISVIVVMVFVVSAVGVGQITDANLQTSQAGEGTQSFAVIQGDSCYTIQPLGNGTKSVAAFYNYRTHDYGYSSRGTLGLQIKSTTQMFFYQGNGGLSLVILNGKTNTSRASGGGTVTFVIEGLPVTGGWIVKDDGYPGANDSFTFNGSTAVVTWKWQGNRTDGGVYQAEPSSWNSQIRIIPHFNMESRANNNSEGGSGMTTGRVERWVVRSGDGEAYALKLFKPITIRPGTCEALSSPDKMQNTSTDQDTSTDQNSSTEQDTMEHKPTTTTSTDQSQMTTQSGTVTDGGGSLATGPGFGIGIAILALLAALVVVIRRR